MNRYGSTFLMDRDLCYAPEKRGLHAYQTCLFSDALDSKRTAIPVHHRHLPRPFQLFMYSLQSVLCSSSPAQL